MNGLQKISFKKSNAMSYRVIILCLISSIILPSEAFFFPKSFFRSSTTEHQTPAASFPQPQQHPRVLGGGNAPPRFPGEHLQGSGTDVQPAIRIVNRPPQPPRHTGQFQEASGPPPGSSFHVPRELCLACEKFPWMPMAGGERPPPSNSAAAASPSQAQPFITSHSNQPTKTIVINALGEAQGPVPIPPNSVPNRRPFAIQFDGAQTGVNNVGGYQEEGRKQQSQQQQQPSHQNQQISEPRPPHPPPTGPSSGTEQKQNRPISFQIYEAETPKPPTILHQVSQTLGVEGTGPSQEYGQPTILQPQNVPPKQPIEEKPIAQPPPSFVPQPQQQPPPAPNPLTVGTIVASQQNGGGRVPEFHSVQPAQLVYHEHFTQGMPPQGQNFKIPIIPQQAQNIPDMKPPPPPPNSGYVQNNNVRPPPQNLFMQMRPPVPFPFPRPSTNMKPPGPMIHYGKPVHIPNNINGPQKYMFPPPPPQGYLQLGPPPPHFGPSNGVDSNSIRQQDERRPSPSGQVLNVQIPNNNVQFPHNSQVNPVPIPNNPQNAGPRPYAPQNNELIRPDAQVPSFTQETAAWEIIPSIQTDLTHFFTPGNAPQNPQGADLPVPVPIPVPQSHQPKSPLFIVQTNQGQDDTQIRVQDVSYHEEARKPSPTDTSAPSLIKENEIKQDEPSNSISESQPQPQTEEGNYRVNPSPPQFIRPRPFILGVPSSGQPPMRPVVFAQQPHPTPFQPSLSPSIMTDLKHAQQTSLLTHQYLTQGNGLQPVREGIFVRPVVTAILNSQGQPQYNQQQQQNLIQEASQVNQGIDPRIPHNCQNIQQIVGTGQTNFRQEPVETEKEVEPTGKDNQQENEASQSLNSVVEDAQPTSETIQETPSTPAGVRGSVNLQDNGNKGSYVLYYPKPVSKSPFYWVQQQPGGVSPGVVRLSPQQMSPVPPSVHSSLVSWSRPRVVVANQFRTDYRGQQIQQQQQTNEQENAQESFRQEEVNSGRQEPTEPEHSTNDDDNIPYGEKLGVNRDKGRTPYDIVSVGGSDEIQQSLEDESSSQTVHTPEQPKEPEETDFNSSNDESTNRYVGEYAGEITGGEEQDNSRPVQTVEDGNNIGNNFENDDDADDEREDFGLRPQTTYRKPVSTTVIHSPGASSFQSMKLPNFKPHRVIVHDFTSHSAKAASTGPSDNFSQNQAFFPSSSTKAPSIWEQQGGRIKAPKYVENDEEEEDSSAESINRPQGLNIQEVIASGPVQTADCVTTTHLGHHALASSTSAPRSVYGGDRDVNGAYSTRGREIYFPLGSRFPGGRPSIFSNHRPTTSSSTTIAPNEDEPNLITTTNRSFGGFAASIPVPVYRRPISISNNLNEHVDNILASDQVTYVKPQTNVLVAEDIYRESEGKEETKTSSPFPFPETSTPSFSTSSEAETVDPSDVIMSTEKSSSFSVSIGESKSRLEAGKPFRRKVVHVTSVPVVTTTTEAESGGDVTSTTSVPPAASTSTKIVKTVRVRQRMRSGQFNGPQRTRFLGQGSRVRVVHRPATEYIRHFPEFSTQEGDKLAKEEEQEVKNALIELKKSPESIKTH